MYTHPNSLNSKVTKKDSTVGVEGSQSTVAEEKKSVSIKEERRQITKRAEENLKLLAKATKADRGHEQAIERSQSPKAHGGVLGLQVRLNISSVDAPQAKKVFVIKRTDGLAKLLIRAKGKLGLNKAPKAAQYADSKLSLLDLNTIPDDSHVLILTKVKETDSRGEVDKATATSNSASSAPAPKPLEPLPPPLTSKATVLEVDHGPYVLQKDDSSMRREETKATTSFNVSSSSAPPASMPLEPPNPPPLDPDHEDTVLDMDHYDHDLLQKMVKAHSDRTAALESYKIRIRSADNNNKRSAELGEKMKAFRASKSGASILERRGELPAYRMQDTIVSTILQNQVTVIAGETGCGKTTQIPQFLIDHYIKNGQGGEIHMICTQPRRLSAVAVAERVASERDETVGKSIGYSIRLEQRQSDDTLCLFCTTGILLRRLLGSSSLEGISHVLVDEVHERDKLSDFLLILLKRLLPLRPDLKVVLMSATVNPTLFSSYFENCPVLSIPGRTFPIQVHFLEDVLQMTNYGGMKMDEPFLDGIVGKLGRKASKNDSVEPILLPPCGLPKSLEKAFHILDQATGHKVMDLNLVSLLVKYVCVHGKEGAILVFLPGLAEIRHLHSLLLSSPDSPGSHRNAGGKGKRGGGKYGKGKRGGNTHSSGQHIVNSSAGENHSDDPRTMNLNSEKYMILPLHSSLTNHEQKNIFRKPKPGVRKIVLSTNIAETSITIEDVVHVVDCAQVNELSQNPSTRLSSLQKTLISRASAKQRRGRAGRVAPGHCYHIVSQRVFHKIMKEEQSPEIRRTSLEDLILQVKLLKLGSVVTFFEAAIQPPKKEMVASSIQRLVKIKALVEHSAQTGSDGDGLVLTPLGFHLSLLPVDVQLGKMLIYGSILGVQDTVLTIAAAMSLKSPFQAPYNEKQKSERIKRDRFGHFKSDQLAVVDAYEQWQAEKQKSGGDERRFCHENCLSLQTLCQIQDLKNRFHNILLESGFAAKPDKGAEFEAYNCNAKNTPVVLSVLCAGLYPNIGLILPVTQTTPGSPPKMKVFIDLQSSATVHPSSVNAGALGGHSKDLVVYFENLETTQLFVRDTTIISAYSALLFGGDIIIDHKQNLTYMDGWIGFKMDPQLAMLFKMVRKQLDQFLLSKIITQGEDIGQKREEILEAILKLLKAEQFVNKT